MSVPSGEGLPFGQPIDASATNPQQQPPPPGWEQGTWTQQGTPAPASNPWRWVLVGGGVVLAVAVIVALVLTFG
jgi:hypothetical protein